MAVRTGLQAQVLGNCRVDARLPEEAEPQLGRGGENSAQACDCVLIP